MSETLVSGSTEQTKAEIHSETVRSVSFAFRLLFGLANMITGLCNLTIYQALLPGQVAALDPANKVTIITVVSALGALGAAIANPLAGALSDHTTSRLGRRRPWLIGATLLAFIVLILMAQARNVLWLGIGAVCTQILMNIVLAALTAIIPDQVPLQQRATVSAFAGMAPLVGGVIGLALITQVVRGTQAAYYAIAVLSLLFLGLFLLILRDKPLPKNAAPALSLKIFLANFWVNPLKHPDFGYTFLARFFVFMGYSVTVMFTFYFLQDAVKYGVVSPGQAANPAVITQGVAIFQTIVVGALFVTSIIGGIISDRLQRRKPFVVGASMVMTVALLLLAFFPIWSFVLVAAAILGFGFGIYLSVDLALATQVSPTESEHGKYLGIMNAAIFVPLIVAPALAGFTLGMFHSYTALFLVAAFCTMLASALILPIKSVR